MHTVKVLIQKVLFLKSDSEITEEEKHNTNKLAKKLVMPFSLLGSFFVLVYIIPTAIEEGNWWDSVPMIILVGLVNFVIWFTIKPSHT